MNKKEVLCPLPFVHPFFDVRGYYSACCNGEIRHKEHVSQMTAEEWFYSAEMEKLRQDMIDGVRNPMCDHCWKKDDLGLASPRLNHINFWSWKDVDYDNPKPQYFDLKPSNHCNLACIFCTGSSSDKIVKITESLIESHRPIRWNSSTKQIRELEKVGTFDNSVVDYIKENIKDLELLKFTGGEPFLSKEVLEILTLVSEIKPEVEIKITSNGTVITKDFYPILEKMKKTSIKFSIDAVDNLYNYIRFPSKWDQFQERIKNSMTNLPSVKFNVNCLITCMNLEQLPKIRDWFKTLQEECKNLEYIVIDPNMSPDDNESGLKSMDPVVLDKIKTILQQESENWNTEDRTDQQFFNVFKSIDNAIKNNLFAKNKKFIAGEFKKHNSIRKIKVQDVVEPTTQQFFTELL